MKLRMLHALPLALLALGACDQDQTGTTHTTSGSAPAGSNQSNPSDQPGGVEGPDRMPMTQGTSPDDLSLQRRIRSAILADETMSADAKNVEVITSQGKVWLRGPVKSEEQRAKVEAVASALAGAGRVQDQIDVEKSR